MTYDNEIYCMFEQNCEGNITEMPTPYRIKYYENMLKQSISYFEYDCLKDLNNRTDYWEYEYEFLCDGKNNQFELNPLPPEEIQFYVAIKEDSESVWKEILEYKYNEITGMLELPASPKCGYEVLVVTYRNGYFEDNLNMKEKYILMLGMLTVFNTKQLEKQQQLSYQVFGSSTKAFSKSEHIKALNEIKENSIRNLKSEINSYTFKSAPDKLYSLGGREYMYGHPYNTGGW